MKTEEIVNEILADVADLIAQAQKEAYNQAIDQILKLMYDHEEEIYIGVFEDIEKLKK